MSNHFDSIDDITQDDPILYPHVPAAAFFANHECSRCGKRGDPHYALPLRLGGGSLCRRCKPYRRQFEEHLRTGRWIAA